LPPSASLEPAKAMTDETPRNRTSPSPEHTAEEGRERWTATRVVAILFLIPSVPMLLGSVAALALFYVAPVRFGGLIARLPADEFIRTVLFFAPATLFALVVLAFLYAREPGPATSAASEPAQATTVPRHPARWAARWALGLITPAFLAAVLALLFSLVAPGRFSGWLEPLPGDRYLRPLVPVMPVVLLALGVVAILLAFPRRQPATKNQEGARPARTTRTVVGLILVSSLAMLALSLLALGISYVQPDRFQRLMSRLEPETFLRLALLFAPAILTAVVILALLYLIGRAIGEPARAINSTQVQWASAQARSTLAVSVLVSGLLLSTVVALGLLAVLAVLLLR
jgi:hypothetical protein